MNIVWLFCKKKSLPGSTCLPVQTTHQQNYRKVSNVSGTKSQNLNDSRLVLQLSLPNPLKPGDNSRMKM